MSENLCYTDAYLRMVEATVTAIEPAPEDGSTGPLVGLDRTVFYPGGGGQPSDTGTLIRASDGTTWHVRGARKVDGEIGHELAISGQVRAELLPRAGDTLTAEIDWDQIGRAHV